jgi:hypothetical protein
MILIISGMGEAEKEAGFGFGFPGEDAATNDPGEAGKWVRVYSEMIRFKEQVLAAAHAGIEDIAEAIAREAAIEADLPLLERENHRLRERLEFWKQRHLELEMPA